MTLLLVTDGIVVHLAIEDMWKLMCGSLTAHSEHVKSDHPTCIECTRKLWTLERRFPVKYDHWYAL